MDVLLKGGCGNRDAYKFVACVRRDLLAPVSLFTWSPAGVRLCAGSAACHVADVGAMRRQKQSKKRSTKKRPGVPCGWRFCLRRDPEEKPQILQIRVKRGVLCPRYFCKLVTAAEFGGKCEAPGKGRGGSGGPVRQR
ncbi:MAG TPA: hypothetical protein VE028_02275 [Nitratidesulfovibrio sp.]|nr:hypothetical protein [Nitratidesulfovibrio sp.]